MKEIAFHHGALCDSYEEQARVQGLTFGDKAEWVQDVGFGIICAHIHDCITDKEYDRILQRFQKKVLLPNLKPMERSEEG